MITGHLTTLPLATLPHLLSNLPARPGYQLAILQAHDDGKIQPVGEAGFCTIGVAQTAPSESPHTEFHRQYLDIQVVLEEEKR
ncbi:YhcH/YjgK/YiaL family protein [Pantoea sp. MBD-2R]|uniref:YhcH/YjgK/YiaL family protein n=1 Tax=unclassified Pantoea TaxID=2630326 RepID=UPI0011BDF897|nr:YhcH/YjgK/YiaL family protein [Pantoea sp. CCBC3-3-1]